MFLYLGGDAAIFTSDILGIFDLDNTSVGKITREYLKKRQEENCVSSDAPGLPKSFVVTAGSGSARIHLSPNAPATLAQRLKETGI